MIHTGEDFVFLSDEMLEKLNISPPEVADAIEAALVAKAEGRLHTSPKTAILPGRARYMMSTLAVGDDGFIVVKQVSLCPENPKQDLPAINGAVMVLDAETGLLRAVVGANWITAIRTAALSAVAARRLADPASETLTFVGAGVQAHSHLAAFSTLFPLKRIRVFGRGQANMQKLCKTAKDMGFDTEVSTSPEAALNDADLVVTSINLDFSIKPFLDARWLKKNAFAAITDACIPWVPDSMEAFKTVIVDDLTQEAESEKPMLPYEQINDDLTGLVTGKQSLETPSAFAFRGIALGDYAVAVLAVQRAEAAGLGQRISP
ncbi:MAG: ornithine cyclodeaminase family protein [Paracoccaceae bacterium]